MSDAEKYRVLETLCRALIDAYDNDPGEDEVDDCIDAIENFIGPDED
jgi:hypothetical protein